MPFQGLLSVSIFFLNHKMSISMCCFAMNGAVKHFVTAVLFRDRLPPFKLIIIPSEMANIGILLNSHLCTKIWTCIIEIK